MTIQLSLLDPPRGPSTLSSFHVRSEMPVVEALAGQERAQTQEAVILAWFKRQRQGARLAPSDVWEAFSWWPITSVRRALSNLTRKGQLVHFPRERVDGPMGAKESTWGIE